MSILVPEQRPDKNGKLVTRHVRAQSGIDAIAGSIPPPSLFESTPSRPAFEDLGYDGLVEATKERFSDLGLSVPSIMPQLLRQLRYGSSNTEAADKKFYEMLPSIDKQGMVSLTDAMSGMSPTNSTTMSSLNSQVFGMAIHAYEYSRVIDDATLPLPYQRNAPTLLSVAVNMFADSDYRLTITPDNVADLESHYFLRALDLGKGSFYSTGDYYRALGVLKEKREELKPYLPLLIALNTAFNDTRGGFYFKDEYYLWENIDMVQKYPVDRIEAIAKSAIHRGEFDEGFADEIANSNHDALNEGIL